MFFDVFHVFLISDIKHVFFYSHIDVFTTMLSLNILLSHSRSFKVIRNDTDDQAVRSH